VLASGTEQRAPVGVSSDLPAWMKRTWSGTAEGCGQPAARKTSESKDRFTQRPLQGSEGMKVHQVQYASAKIDQALEGAAGRQGPLNSGSGRADAIDLKRELQS